MSGRRSDACRPVRGGVETFEQIQSFVNDPEKIPILAGGRAAANYAGALSGVGASTFGSIGELRAWLTAANAAQ